MNLQIDPNSISAVLLKSVEGKLVRWQLQLSGSFTRQGPPEILGVCCMEIISRCGGGGAGGLGFRSLEFAIGFILRLLAALPNTHRIRTPAFLCYTLKTQALMHMSHYSVVRTAEDHSVLAENAFARSYPHPPQPFQNPNPTLPRTKAFFTTPSTLFVPSLELVGPF